MPETHVTETSNPDYRLCACGHYWIDHDAGGLSENLIFPSKCRVCDCRDLRFVESAPHASVSGGTQTGDPHDRFFLGSTGLPCADCGQPHEEYVVESGLWDAVVRPDGKEHESEYLCIRCFLTRVKQRLSYVHELLNSAYAAIDPDRHEELTNRIADEFDTCQSRYDNLQQALTEARATIQQKDQELKEIAEARERIHARWKSGDKCECPYCTRDFDGLVELAAEYEWNRHTVQRKLEAAEATITARDQEIALLKGALSAQDKREQRAGERCGILWHEYGCDWPDAAAEALIVVRAERDTLRQQLVDSESFWNGDGE